MYHQLPQDAKNLAQKLEDLEGIQAQERDKLVVSNKNMEVKINDLENIIKTLLAQVQDSVQSVQKVAQYDLNSGIQLGTPGLIPR